MDRLDGLLLALLLASLALMITGLAKAAHYSAVADTFRNQPAREAALLAEFAR